MKVDEVVKCPYCNNKDLYTFYINSDSLICNYCNKEFAIKLKQVIVTEVLSDVLNTHQCNKCGTKFNESNLPRNLRCHKCGTELYEITYHDSPVYHK